MPGANYIPDPSSKKRRWSLDDEIVNKRADLAARIRPFVSDKWLLIEIFKFTPGEADQLLLERRCESSTLSGVGTDLAPLRAPPGRTLTMDDIEEARRILAAKKNETEDIEYFKRNMRKALKVPKDYMPAAPGEPKPDRLVVGPNDILVINVDCSNIPPPKTDEFLMKAKRALCPLLDARGLKDRHLWVGGDHTGFLVIEVQESKKSPLDPDAPRHIHIDLAKPKTRPPLMS